MILSETDSNLARDLMSSYRELFGVSDDELGVIGKPFFPRFQMTQSSLPETLSSSSYEFVKSRARVDSVSERIINNTK